MAHNKYSQILTSSHLFYINFDLRRIARLFKELYMTGYICEDAYCGVVKIDPSRTDFFLGQINYLEVAVVDVGNNLLHGLAKERIYTMAKLGVVVADWLGMYYYISKNLGYNPMHPPSPPRHAPGEKYTTIGIIVKSTAGH